MCNIYGSLNDRQRNIIEHVINTHYHLNGRSGIVIYAIIDDCMRKLHNTVPREQVADVVRHITKDR